MYTTTFCNSNKYTYYCSPPLHLTSSSLSSSLFSKMSGSSSSRFPFTATQWQELEHQALVFKYIVSGIPIPSDLLFTIRTSLDTSLSSKFLIHHPQHLGGWNSSSFHHQMGFGRKIDPEPGRCRRTDGKKWRCSKEAYPDSKYCERHMHRGRNRSRKPVETLSPSATNTPAPQSHFLYPPSRPPTQETPTFFLQPPKDFSSSSSYGHGMKGHYSSDLDKIDNGALNVDREEEQPKKVMHHFLDEWQPPKDKKDSCWTNSEDKMPTHRTQLSISIPNSSMHDFFLTQKW